MLKTDDNIVVVAFRPLYEGEEGKDSLAVFTVKVPEDENGKRGEHEKLAIRHLLAFFWWSGYTVAVLDWKNLGLYLALPDVTENTPEGLKADEYGIRFRLENPEELNDFTADELADDIRTVLSFEGVTVMIGDQSVAEAVEQEDDSDVPF